MHTQDEDVATAHVAKRALAVVNDDKHVEAYYMGWHEAQSNPYDAVQNPGGCIQLGLSENTVIVVPSTIAELTRSLSFLSINQHLKLCEAFIKIREQ